LLAHVRELTDWTFLPGGKRLGANTRCTRAPPATTRGETPEGDVLERVHEVATNGLPPPVESPQGFDILPPGHALDQTIKLPSGRNRPSIVQRRHLGEDVVGATAEDASFYMVRRFGGRLSATKAFHDI
jgi:hypothetical protein